MKSSIKRQKFARRRHSGTPKRRQAAGQAVPWERTRKTVKRRTAPPAHTPVALKEGSFVMGRWNDKATTQLGAALLQQQSVALCGDAGAGKLRTATQACRQNGREYFIAQQPQGSIQRMFERMMTLLDQPDDRCVRILPRACTFLQAIQGGPDASENAARVRAFHAMCSARQVVLLVSEVRAVYSVLLKLGVTKVTLWTPTPVQIQRVMEQRLAENACSIVPASILEQLAGATLRAAMSGLEEYCRTGVLTLPPRRPTAVFTSYFEAAYVFLQPWRTRHAHRRYLHLHMEESTHDWDWARAAFQTYTGMAQLLYLNLHHAVTPLPRYAGTLLHPLCSSPASCAGRTPFDKKVLREAKDRLTRIRQTMSILAETGGHRESFADLYVAVGVRHCLPRPAFSDAIRIESIWKTGSRGGCSRVSARSGVEEVSDLVDSVTPTSDPSIWKFIDQRFEQCVKQVPLHMGADLRRKCRTRRARWRTQHKTARRDGGVDTTIYRWESETEEQWWARTKSDLK